jgi:hypothetical protein
MHYYGCILSYDAAALLALGGGLVTLVLAKAVGASVVLFARRSAGLQKAV